MAVGNLSASLGTVSVTSGLQTLMMSSDLRNGLYLEDQFGVLGSNIETKTRYSYSGNRVTRVMPSRAQSTVPSVERGQSLQFLYRIISSF